MKLENFFHKIYKKLKNLNIKKIILVSGISLVSLIIILCMVGYFIIHNYISKMNLINPKEEEMMEYEIEDDLEDEFDFYDEELDYDNYGGQSQEDRYMSFSKSLSISEDENDNQITSSLDMDKIDENLLKEQGYDEIYEYEEAIRKNIEDESIPIMEDKNVFNILLIGRDARSSQERGRSDTMILVSINKKNKTITATSLLRDIYLEIPGKKNNRLNSAYSSGGAKLLMETIKQNFKIQIDKYISVDFFAFIDIVDAVGGISIDISEDEVEYANESIREVNYLLGEDLNQDIIREPGLQMMNGKQVLGFARIRSIGTDFGRTARQREVLELIFNKIKNSSIIDLHHMLNKILPQVTTNLTEGEIFEQILKLPSYSKYQLQQWSIPIKGSYKNMRIRKMAVLGIDFNKNIEEIYNRIYLTD
ncbi:MAG TPA: LCP family protein [Clostridiales bacterium]|nr:LCP family protein [Clostridiales bacterium]